MKNKKLLLIVLMALVLALGAFASTAFAAEGNDIIIIYENDIHCNVDGYSKLAALKKELADTGAYVGVVSSGDYLQGDIIGNLSKGEYITKLMNTVGYDAAALGNHEFDYRLPRLFELVDMMNTKPICSNFKSLVDNKTIFEPYSIVSYGDTDIAYIGITTPDTITSSSPSQFMDQNGNHIYSFSDGSLFETVQQSIDDAKAKGADYIIALSHLGTEYVLEKWSAQQLVKNTSGLDIVLDAHSHSVVESMTVADKSGNEVIITSTGQKFANIGKLTISEGKITTELIPAESYQKTDAELDKLISDINNKFKDSLNRVVGKSSVILTTVDKDGNRIIRHQETNLGDFCADAFRVVSDADVAFINGGGMRGNIDIGDVTVNDLLSVFPWGNTLCAAKVTGRQIADMLELSVFYYPVENGSFQHVSGLSFVLNSSIPTSVKLDENTAFVAVEGERRVSDIKVLDKASGEYKPLDFDKEYILASHNHLLINLGGGANMFKDAEIVLNDNMLDIEVLEKYITEHLNGVIDEQYAKSQNRITVISQAVNPTTGVELDLAA